MINISLPASAVNIKPLPGYVFGIHRRRHVYTISRTYSFSAAHRIEGHPKCGRLHGHNYDILVELRHSVIDETGMLLDYGELDKVVKPLIDQLDHRYIYSNSNLAANDGYAELAEKKGDAAFLQIDATTAECLARMFFEWIFHALIQAGVQPNQLTIEVRETAKSTATYTEEP